MISAMLELVECYFGRRCLANCGDKQQLGSSIFFNITKSMADLETFANKENIPLVRDTSVSASVPTKSRIPLREFSQKEIDALKQGAHARNCERTHNLRLDGATRNMRNMR